MKNYINESAVSNLVTGRKKPPVNKAWDIFTKKLDKIIEKEAEEFKELYQK